MSQRKIALIIGYGQSNENGTGVAARLAGTAIAAADTANNIRHQSIFGQANVSLTTTAPYVQMTSMFQLLAESIAARTGHCVEVINKSIGGTAATDSWCGWDSRVPRICTPGETSQAGTTGTGMGTGTGSTGYDPASYIANFLTAITTAVAQGYEVWTLTAGHQTDLTLARSTAQIIAASAHIQNRALAAGASKVFVGKTPRYISGATEAEWNAGGAIHQIAEGVLAAVPGSFAGGDLSGNLDTKLCATDNLQYIHLNHAGVCWAAGVWRDALIAGGHI